MTTKRNFLLLLIRMQRRCIGEQNKTVIDSTILVCASDKLLLQPKQHITQELANIFNYN